MPRQNCTKCTEQGTHFTRRSATISYWCRAHAPSTATHIAASDGVHHRSALEAIAALREIGVTE